MLDERENQRKFYFNTTNMSRASFVLQKHPKYGVSDRRHIDCTYLKCFHVHMLFPSASLYPSLTLADLSTSARFFAQQSSQPIGSRATQKSSHSPCDRSTAPKFHYAPWSTPLRSPVPLKMRFRTRVESPLKASNDPMQF